jgi:hypothetical protein
MIFVTNGRIKQYLDTTEYVAEKGEVIFIKQGTITATIELSDDIEGFFLAYENSILSEQELPKHKTSIFFMTPFLHLDNLTYTTITQLLVILEQELLLNNLDVNDVTVTMLHLILVKMLSSDSGSHHKMAQDPWNYHSSSGTYCSSIILPKSVLYFMPISFLLPKTI